MRSWSTVAISLAIWVQSSSAPAFALSAPEQLTDESAEEPVPELTYPAYPVGPPACGTAAFEALVRPLAPGPFELHTILCDRPSGIYGPIVSPDGKHVAAFRRVDRRVLQVEPVSGNAPIRSFDLVRVDRANLGPEAQSPYRWSQTSNGIWIVKPDLDNRSGPVKPAFLSLGGAIADLPELRHEAGSPDGVVWVEGSGRAIVRFRNHQVGAAPKYLPPAYAMVDASEGAILDSFDVPDFERLRAKHQELSESFYTDFILASQRTDGRLQALFNFGRWILWTQGEEAKVLQDLPLSTGAAMSEDGETILLFRPKLPGEDNRGWRVWCEAPDDDYARYCRSSPAREGTWASLHKVQTGKLLWSLRWRFNQDDHGEKYALSPDGRFALLTLRSRAGSWRNYFGVVSMADGKVLQTLNAPVAISHSYHSFGFADSGRLAWIKAWDATIFFKVH